MNITTPSEKELNLLLNYFNDGRLYDAEELALSISNKFPEHEFAWRALGVIYKRQNKKKEALNANKKALNIANTIIRNFIKNPDIKKLFVIRNEKFKKIISNKVIFLSTNQFTSYQNILKQFQNNDEIILVAPEIEQKSINLYEELKKRFNILCSTYCTVKTFSSKINSLVALKKRKLPVVDFAQTNCLPYKKIIVKPIYGAGSHEVFLIENK